MNAPERPDALARAYEALRAQATGEMPSATPRGLALLLAPGLPAWMKAWAPLTPPSLAVPVPGGHCGVAVGFGGDVARLLTEMALSCQRRWATT